MIKNFINKLLKSKKIFKGTTSEKINVFFAFNTVQFLKPIHPAKNSIVAQKNFFKSKKFLATTIIPFAFYLTRYLFLMNTFCNCLPKRH